MVKTLLAHVKEYKKVSLLTPVMMILEVIVEMFIPYVMASMVDKGVETGDIDHVLFTGGIMVVLIAIGLYTGIMGGVLGAKASTGFAKNLREGMYTNIQTFSFSNIDKFSTAGLITRLTTDVTNVQMAYQMLLRMCTRAPITLVVAMILAFRINARLSLIYLCAVIFLSIVLSFLVRKTMRYFSEVFKKYDALNASVQENVSAIRVVKAFVREDYEKGKFGKASYNIYKMFLKAETMIAFNAPIMMFTIYSCILLISWFGAHMIVVNDLTTGELMSLLTYCMNILTSLMILSMMFVMVTMSVASGKRIAEVLDEEPDITNPENPVMEVSDGSIDFKNVNFSYFKDKGDAEYVLKNINLSIKQGETIGILGGTGSAKTSLINLISRLYDVSEGEVFVGGRNVKEYDLETLRDEVSVVLQKNVLFSGSIFENLKWGDKNATEEDMKRACELACASEFIEALPEGYSSHVEQGGANFSGGQRQRLCIARALLKKPKVLILDDSTSAVDTATDAKIREAFRSEIPNTTKIIIAQRINSVSDADRIIVMDDGEISGIGTHEELLNTNEIYKDVYESQTGGSGDFDEVGGDK